MHKERNEVELLPGSITNCSDCSSRNIKLIVVDTQLCCEVCNSPIGGKFDYFDYAPTRSSYQEEGAVDQGAGHGPGHQIGDTIPGTKIGQGSGISIGARREQDRENYRHGGTPAKILAKSMIRTQLSEFPALKKTAIDLLDKVAWPDTGKDRTPQFKLVWQAAHPWGVVGAVAASIHAAHQQHGLRADIQKLIALFPKEGDKNPCPKPNKFLNKAIKIMTKRMGPRYASRALNRVKRAQRLIDTLVARNQLLLPIHNTLYNDATRMAEDIHHFPDNLINPLACLTWFVANEYDAKMLKEGGKRLQLSVNAIAELFDFANTSAAFRVWGNKIAKYLRDSPQEPDFNGSNSVEEMER
jgi:hypothetical protein